MKIKPIIATLGLALLAVVSTAFVQKTPHPTKPLEAAEKEAFLQYLSQFKKVELPYSIGLDDFKGYETYRGIQPKKPGQGPNPISINPTPYLPASNTGKFSRMGPPVLEAIARFYPNDQMVAVVYSSRSPFAGEEFVNYCLLVYDLAGNLLPRQKGKLSNPKALELAYSSLEKTMTCTIDANGNVSQSVFANKWLKDLYEHGVEGNKITGFKQEETANLLLDKSGMFNEVKPQQSVASRTQP